MDTLNTSLQAQLADATRRLEASEIEAVKAENKVSQLNNRVALCAVKQFIESVSFNKCVVFTGFTSELEDCDRMFLLGSNLHGKKILKC